MLACDTNILLLFQGERNPQKWNVLQRIYNSIKVNVNKINVNKIRQINKIKQIKILKT